jgi:hypothetical protein
MRKAMHYCCTDPIDVALYRLRCGSARKDARDSDIVTISFDYENRRAMPVTSLRFGSKTQEGALVKTLFCDRVCRKGWL